MSKYTRGANFERDLVKHLGKVGYLAVRAAGSKGAEKVDIIAIPPRWSDNFQPIFDDPVGDDDWPLLIQCKTSGAISKFEKELVKNAADKYGCVPVLASKSEDKKIKFEVLK